MVVIGVRAHMPGTSLVVAMAVFARMLGPGTSILRSINQLAAVLPAHAALASLSRALGATEPAIPPQATAAGSTAETIRFDHVSYTHSGGGNPAEGSARLVDLDFTIAPGEIVGIVGASGAGKTTLVDLLCGLIAPQSGEIRVGATVLAGTALHRWRDGAAYIAQDCYLFNDTLRRNLCWGLAGIDDAAIAEALAIAEATEVVRSLAHGLEETVGERGIRLSGGERQRLAIARALLRRPVLIVLDEATNALDIATERRILGRLASLPHRPTLLIVAHRPEALEQCNRVLHLDAGRLTAQATAIQTP
jgi:ATP-binding cassette subfamily C protein